MNKETDLLARAMLALWDWRDGNTGADDTNTETVQEAAD